jgi:hypothetical protein
LDPKAADGAGDDARVDGTEVLVVNLQLAGDPGAEILDHHVGAAHKIVEHRQARLAFEVNSDTLLVAVQRDEIGALAVEGVVRIRGQQPARALALERLHLDGLCAEVGEDHGAVGPGQHMRQVQNTNAVQRLGHVVTSRGRAGLGRGTQLPQELNRRVRRNRARTPIPGTYSAS